ncbi:MAG: DUF705 domain-containing protein [Myxococcales bacterium]|nr:DUF705 domain-containing protein [Myxococcales bacterium]
MSEATPRRVIELVTSIEKFLQIPYWFTVRQSLAMSGVPTVESDGLQYEPAHVLVFDQEYQLIGELDPVRLTDALVESLPDELRHAPSNRQPETLSAHWSRLVREGNDRLDQLTVSDVMIPIGPPLVPDDCVLRAFYALASAPNTVLPVIRDGQLLGVVRRADILAELLIQTFT